MINSFKLCRSARCSAGRSPGRWMTNTFAKLKVLQILASRQILTSSAGMAGCLGFWSLVSLDCDAPWCRPFPRTARGAVHNGLTLRRGALRASRQRVLDRAPQSAC
jgi:hypothetical protein